MLGRFVIGGLSSFIMLFVLTVSSAVAADPMVFDQARQLTSGTTPATAALLSNAENVSVRVVGLGLALRYANQAQICKPLPGTFNVHTVFLTDQAETVRHPLYTLSSTQVGAYQYGYAVLAVSIPGYELAEQTWHRLKIVSGADGAKFDCQGVETSLLSDYVVDFKTGEDVFAPDIVTPKVASTLNNALVSWKSGETTTGQVDYGLTPSYGSMVTTAAGLDHQAVMSGLQPGKTYYYRITSRDLQGNQSTKTGTFATWSMGSIEVADITGHEATIRWTTSVPTDSIVEYGSGPSFTLRAGGKDLLTEHNVRLVHLQSDTNYRFRIKATTADGVAVTQALTFATRDASAGLSTEVITFAPQVSGAFDEWNRFNLKDFPEDEFGQASDSADEASSGAVLAASDTEDGAMAYVARGVKTAEQRFGWWVVWIVFPILLLILVVGFYMYYRHETKMNWLRLEIRKSKL